jgi:hypothetical protein
VKIAPEGGYCVEYPPLAAFWGENRSQGGGSTQKGQNRAKKGQNRAKKGQNRAWGGFTIKVLIYYNFIINITRNLAYL